MINDGSALVYIDDILLMSNSKEHMINLIKMLHEISKKENIKLAPEKSFYMLLTVKYLGHEIGYKTINPIHSKIVAIHKIPTPATKIELMRFIGSMNFYSKFIEKLHVNLKPFYDILHDDTKFHWNDELETLFRKIKHSITKDVTLTLPNTKYPFFITVGSSLIGIGCVLFQMNEHGKLDVISYISRIFTTNEQKLCTTYRELIGIVYALTIYEHIIIGSAHFINVLNDHKPILSCFTKKGNLSPIFYTAQMQLTKFQKLRIIYTKGKYLFVADMLSRSFTKEELQLNQLKHKQLPPQIDFAVMNQTNQIYPVHYLVKHEAVQPSQKDDCHPILADYGNDQFSIRINDKGEHVIIKPLDSFSFKAVKLFQQQYKPPLKQNNKTLLQQSTVLNDTDITDFDDPINKRIPNLFDENQSTESSNTETTDISMINNPPSLNQKLSTVSVIQECDKLPVYSQQQLKFFDPSFSPM